MPKSIAMNWLNSYLTFLYCNGSKFCNIKHGSHLVQVWNKTLKDLYFKFKIKFVAPLIIFYERFGRAHR